MKIVFIFVLILSFSLRASDIYVTANITNISTDFALTKAGLVVKINDSDYEYCEGKYVKFYLEDFKSQSIDLEDAKSRLEFTRGIALAAFLSGKKIQFILKEPAGGTCTATGWIKIIN